jgi:hypothetical protein
MLRSKVYLLLKDIKVEKCFEMLERCLTKEQFEEVIEDAHYFVPFPDKLKNILENSQTIEQLVDQVPVRPAIKELILEPRRSNIRRFRPSILLPMIRNPSLLTLKTMVKPLNTIKELQKTMQKEEKIQIVKRIDMNKSLIIPKEARPKNKKFNLEAYKKFHDEFYKSEIVFRQKLKEKYEEDKLLQNKTMKYASLGHRGLSISDSGLLLNSTTNNITKIIYA